MANIIFDWGGRQYEVRADSDQQRDATFQQIREQNPISGAAAPNSLMTRQFDPQSVSLQAAQEFNPDARFNNGGAIATNGLDSPAVLNPINRPNAMPGLGQRDPQFLRGALNSAINGLTINLGDEAARLFGGVRSLFGPETWDEGANATEGRFNADLQHAQEVSPEATFMASLVGGLPLMAVGGGLAMAPSTLLGKMGRGALIGGGTGAAYNYGAGEGGPLSMDRLENAVEGIPIPALLGGFAAPLGQAAGVLGRRVGAGVRKLTGQADEALPPAQTIDELKAEADVFYGQLRAQGVVAPPSAVNQSYTRLVDSLHANGVADDLAIVSQVDRMFNGKQFGFDDLERIRRRASRGMVSAEGEERFAAGLIFDEVSDLIEDTMGAMPAAARYAWSRARKAESLEGLIYRAEVRSEGGSTSFEQALRTQITNLLARKNGTRGFTDDEVAMLRDFNRGTTLDKFQRALARLDPSRSVVAAAFSGAGLVGGAPEMLALGIGGRLARTNLDRTARGRANRISEAVRRGSVPHTDSSSLGYLLPPAVQGGANVYGGQNAPRLDFLNNPNVFGDLIKAR